MLIKNLFLLFSLMFSSIYASIEFDIILLTNPKQEQHCTGIIPAEDLPVLPKIYDDETVIGSIKYKDKVQPFFYHPAKGMKLITIFESKRAFPSMLNKKGILVGCFNSDETPDIPSGIFVYDLKTKKLVDILSHPDFQRFEKFMALYVKITENNLIFVSGLQLNMYDGIEESGRSFCYDLASHTVDFDVKQDFLSINSMKQMIGGDYDFKTTGWFFDPIKGFFDISGLDNPDRWASYPQVLTDTGYVAGKAFGKEEHAKGFLWSADDGFTLINTLGGDFINIQAANKHGDVAGNSILKHNKEHAFLFTKKNGVIDLGVIQGNHSHVLAMNDAQQIVGRSTVSSKFEWWNTEAFIWDKKHGMRLLQSLIPSDSGWEKLLTPTSINNRGQIVGLGIYKGRKQIFLLNPKK